MSGWISVDDRLPAYGAPVIIVVNGVTQNVTFCFYGSDYSCGWFEPYFFHSESEESLNTGEVSHWMPLPEPPKE